MIEHIWCCDCGLETPCRTEDLRLGATWHCAQCDTDFGCVLSGSGCSTWIKIEPDSARFNQLAHYYIDPEHSS